MKELLDALLISASVRIIKPLNAVFSKVGRLVWEEVVLNLIRTKYCCLELLLYGVEACPICLYETKRSLELIVTR